MFEQEDREFTAGRQEDRPLDELQTEDEVSLDGLRDAFAEAMDRWREDGDATDEDRGEDLGQGTDDGDVCEPNVIIEDEAAVGAVAGGAVVEAVDELPSSYAQPSEQDDPCPISPQTILESMLFVGNLENRPLSSGRAAELMRGVEPEEISSLVEQLNSRYASNDCAYRIFAEGSGYRMRLCERFVALRDKFYGRMRQARLSQAAIDVLAIVAYRQPVNGEQVNRLRGKSSGHLLRQLVRRRLLQIERPVERASKPVYRTSDRFLQLFGLNGIDELPQSEGTGR